MCEKQEGIWSDFCSSHPDLKLARGCLNNVPAHHFWSWANQHPDLVDRLHAQVRLVGNFGLNRDVPWPHNTDGAGRFVCKQRVDYAKHFYLNARVSKTNFSFSGII